MPIHRHPALRSLSRDHHVALQLARGLQTNGSPLLRAQLPSEARALAVYVQRLFAKELAAHFDAEDSVLAPAVAGKDPDLDRLVSDIESEHAEMQAVVDRLSDAALDDAGIRGQLDRLGHMVEDHVRREERQYYRRVEEVLDDQTLARIGAELSRHMVFHGRSAA